MKTNVEKHVASLDQVLGFCNNLGVQYAPANQSITIDSLREQLEQARQTLHSYNETRSAYMRAVNARNSVFKWLPGTGTRILSLLISSRADPELIADVKKLKDRFRSPKRKSKKANDGTEVQAPDTSRGPMSQLDVESKIRNFELILDHLKNEPCYVANEPAYTVEGLLAYHEQLVMHQQAVHAMKVALKNASMRRTKMLYGPDGVQQTITSVKRYLLFAFGYTSMEYAKVRSIKKSNL